MTETQPRRRLHSIRQACEILACGRTKFHELLADGEVGFIKVGARTLIPDDDLTDFIHRRYRRRGAKTDAEPEALLR